MEKEIQSPTWRLCIISGINFLSGLTKESRSLIILRTGKLIILGLIYHVNMQLVLFFYNNLQEGLYKPE